MSIHNPPNRHGHHQRWTLADIPYANIDRATLNGNQELFYLVTAASFIEITTDLYTGNLLRLFAGDEEVADWLEHHWLPEELQHGTGLKRYVQTAWPGFDWESAYRRFFTEYSALCAPTELERLPSLELASRCVVEMGTASYYTTLGHFSAEPVLSKLTGFIKQDEVRHYKYFYRYFLRYRDQEHPGRVALLHTLWRRLRMFDGEDGPIAFRSIFAALHPGRTLTPATYRNLRRRCGRAVGRHFPHEMSVRMLLKPLDLTPTAQKMALPVLQLVSHQLVGTR